MLDRIFGSRGIARGFTRVGLSILVFLATAVAFAQPVTPEVKEKVLQNMQGVITRRAYVPGVDFAQWPDFLAKRRAEIDRAADIPTFVTAVNGVLREFGISHIRLMTPTAARARATGQQEGYGVAVQKVADGLSIIQVAPGSPASKLGLEAGDTIVELEGKKNPDSLTVPSPTGTDRDTALVMVKSHRDGSLHMYMLAKKSFSTDRKPTLTWERGNVAVIQLASFTRGYDRAMLEGFIAEANRKKARAVVLDLRNNGGGLVSNCTHLLSLLTPPNTPTGISVNRDIADRYAKATGGDPKDVLAVAKWSGPTTRTRKLTQAPYLGKLIVLLNGRSASASEITAAVLKETRNATLVGRPSAGAVLVSQFVGVNDGFEFQIPLSDYITPHLMRLEKNPLQPDVTVEATRASNDDPDPVIVEALKALGR